MAKYEDILEEIKETELKMFSLTTDTIREELTNQAEMRLTAIREVLITMRQVRMFSETLNKIEGDK